MSSTDTQPSNGETDLRDAIDQIADQICTTVDGAFDTIVRIDTDDDTIGKLQMLVNFLMDSARRAVAEVEAQRESLKQEIGEREQMAITLREGEARISAILNATADAIITIDESGIIRSSNSSTETLFGYRAHELMGQHVTILSAATTPGEHDSYIQRYLRTGHAHIIGSEREVIGRHRDGTQFPILLRIQEMHAHGQRWFVGCVQDITERTKVEEELRDNNVMLIDALVNEKRTMADLEAAMSQLEELATTDKLTNLPNRSVFRDRLEQTMKRSDRDGSRFAVLFFDFDRFKVINDSLGHDVGDALLCHVADRFRSQLRESDTAARFGGDEFVVLLDNLSEWSDAEKKANQLLRAFAEPHDIEGHRIVSTASIGLVTNEHAHQGAADLIRDADAAMYQAKADGRGRVVKFDEAMHEQAVNRLSLEASLRFAVAEDQLRLVYQPIVELATGAVTSFEALVRWDHPQRGVISPFEFIPIAEETGLIIDIGRWVLRTACRQIADWNRRLPLEARLSMNVNISKRQLLGSSLIDDVLTCLTESDVPAEDLKLEVTESSIVDERSDVVPLLTQLRAHGVRIAMDDFGTGVSSLSALHKYPIDVLKIDQSFVRDLDSDRSLLAVVASVTALADNLGVATVAEGIETADTIAALQSIGCTWGQGYYFAKPMTPADAEAYLLGINENKRGA